MKHLITFFALLIVVFGLHSCTTVYYVGETNLPTKIYYLEDTTGMVAYTVPAGKKLLVRKKHNKYYSVVYDTYQGYTYNTPFSNYHKFNSTTDGDLYGYSTSKKNESTSSGSGGTVNVKGYYRKNGTYVQPHTRSSPSHRH